MDVSPTTVKPAKLRERLLNNVLKALPLLTPSQRDQVRSALTANPPPQYQTVEQRGTKGDA